MILRDAFRSMRKDILRCFFYWLTFMLTTLLIFLFENISLSSPQSDAGDMGMSLSVGVMILVVLVCSLDIFFANNFYVKGKAREMAVRLICGATFGQIASFLLLQTLFLLLLAIPAGGGLSILCMPAVTRILEVMTGTYLPITVHSEAVFTSAMIILYIIFWTVLLNLSFAYKNAVGMMSNAGTLLGTAQGSVLKIGLLSDKVLGVMGMVLFLLPVVLFYAAPEASVALTAMGMAGLYLFNKDGFNRLLTGIIRKKISSSLKLASDGLARRDILVLNQNILLYFLTASVLASLLIGHLDEPADAALLMVSYVLMTFLQSMSLMFRFASECSSRRKDFHIFHALGFTKKEQRKIISREIRTVFLMIILSSMLYSFNMMGSFMVHNNLGIQLAAALVLIQILPFILWGFIIGAYYRKTAGVD